MKAYKKNKIKVPLTFGGVVWQSIKWFVYGVMLLAAVSFIFMFIWILLNSFKTGIEYSENVFNISKTMDWENYKQVLDNLNFKGHGLYGMLVNSIILVLWNVFATMVFPHIAAYPLARFDFKGKKLLESVIWISMVVPIIGGSSSTMWFLNAIGLYDNFLGVFLLNAGGLGFGQIMLTAFYRGVSTTYAEAAYMDGAAEWTVFTKIYYPQAMPLTLIFVVQTVITTWNDYMTGYMYLPSHPTLALGLQQMQAQFVDFGADYPVMFAGIVLAMIPVLTVYFAFSDKITNNSSLGAMK